MGTGSGGEPSDVSLVPGSPDRYGWPYEMKAPVNMSMVNDHVLEGLWTQFKLAQKKKNVVLITEIPGSIGHWDSGLFASRC